VVGGIRGSVLVALGLSAAGTACGQRPGEHTPALESQRITEAPCIVYVITKEEAESIFRRRESQPS
jgi:hypothetical protein